MNTAVESFKLVHRASVWPIVWRYAFAAIGFAALAWALRPAGLVLLWPAAALATVTAAYASGGAGMFGKRAGRLGMPARLLLAPYLLGTWAMHRWWSRHLPAWIQVTPHLLMGRRLTRREATELKALGVIAVLDLAAEIDEAPDLLDLAYLNLPVLDLTAVSREHLDEGINFIRQHTNEGIVFVHCALGLSRSVRVVAEYLLAEGVCARLDDAIMLLRRAQREADLLPAG